MALTFLPQSGHWNAEMESVHFDARHDRKPVSCLIHKVALADLLNLRNANQDDLLAGFEKQRKKIEDIAAWKYEKGSIRRDGSVFITSQDLDAYEKRNLVERDVTLVFDSNKVHYDTLHDWVRFYALDGEISVPCAVTRGALLDRERITDADEKRLVDAYLRNRQVIDTIAESKYKNSLVEPGGVVVVMSRDLNH
ncbi:DUF1488 family protein [Dongia soli]|uniref:DUF1488 family protein n=1 Tax=Dongia soli TaxID=600628 RepID=A0ABU5EG39_9PROT|nr:DUF1488 family protein [Dongia soli]MDY0884872.1 DUF1488 family protein [Dongia soli]